MTQIGTKHITLSQLTSAVGHAISGALPNELWVVAEISECKVAAAGHCYLSLVERAQGAPMPLAEMRAAIWANKYRSIAADFRAQTGTTLASGMKVLVKCGVSFHALYGLSLVISDIDPTYTLGEGERQRQLTIEQLKADGIFDMQRELPLPQIVQRVAVISSATAAGYEDFMKHIQDSAYKFYIDLYPASMQGEQTERTVIDALDKIAADAAKYDAVVIIRGGGSAGDLRWFDAYNLACNVAQFPLPIFTGIGHEKDISVTDMVAHTMHKTPTAVAAALISGLKTADDHHRDMYSAIVYAAQQRLVGETARVERAAQNLRSGTVNSMKNAAVRLEKLLSALNIGVSQNLAAKKARLDQLKTYVATVAMQSLERQQNRLNIMQEQVKAKNPRAILSMGYSIVRSASGNAVKSVKDAPKGTQLNVEVSDGKITTTVN